MVSLRYRKWCPRGCGKSVFFLYQNHQGGNRKGVFECERCLESFEGHEQLNKAQAAVGLR